MEENKSVVYHNKRDNNADLILINMVLNNLIKGFLAGLMIAIGGTAFLSVDSKYLGSFLFSIVFITIFYYGFNLFSCKVGYFTVQNKQERLMLIPIWLGNFLGTTIVGTFLKLTGIFQKIGTRAAELSYNKMSDSFLSAIILSILCGFLIFIATDGFKNSKNDIQKYIMVILCTMVFSLCGFEHSISNMFYFTVGNFWSFKSIGYLILMTIGNALGAMIIPACHKLIGFIFSKIKESKNQ